MTVGAASIALDAGQPDTEKLRRTGAAGDFEALLVSQMMKSVREEGSGWLGTGEDQSADAAFGLAENEFARAIAGSGGFGLAKVIEKGLTLRKAEESPSTHQS